MPGDGISDSGKVYRGRRTSPRNASSPSTWQTLADSTGSVISAVLFGALAGSGALPFGREALRSDDPRRRHRHRAEPARLRGRLSSARRRMRHRRHRPQPPKPASAGKLYPALAPIGDAAFDALVADARTTFPASLHGMIAAGLRKVVDFQDVGLRPRISRSRRRLPAPGARRRSRVDAGGRQTHRRRHGL